MELSLTAIVAATFFVLAAGLIIGRLAAGSKGVFSENENEAMRADLEEDIDRLRAERNGFRDEATALKIENAKLDTTLIKEREAQAEKLALLESAEERLKLQFQTVAAEILKGHSTTFTKQNKEQLEGLLNPLGTRIKEFDESLKKAHMETVTERSILKVQIENLTTTSTDMMAETTNLTRALKGDSKTQGAWGEIILETILEKSGLRAGVEYIAQSTHTDDAGNRLRPDFLVNLPGDQRIVIDSKVSLTAYDAFIAAEDLEERTRHLRAHIQSMRTHIKQLGEKNYQLAARSHLDYVIMFVPIEGALAAALQEDPDLTLYAIDQNVQITPPNNLMALLRTISNVWQVERRNHNAEEIALRAGGLYDKFVGFTKDMEAIGASLDKAKGSYNTALGKMSSGRGNIVRQIEQLKEMGAKTSKSVAPDLLDESDHLGGEDIETGAGIELVSDNSKPAAE
ncbi:MAG: DNA recombination protein RmuC [Rhodospirillales bacterium]|nr:DNA recombination protein RmuC [Rhodospirillales bacterium]